MHRKFFSLPRRGRHELTDRQRIAPRGRVVRAFRGDGRRPRLVVPAFELSEIDARRIGHRLHEVVASHGVAIVTFEIQIHAAPEGRAAEQRVDHPHDFGALLVHGRRIEVRNLHVRLRTHRVSHGSGVLRELPGA